jgi:hypothetical protein
MSGSRREFLHGIGSLGALALFRLERTEPDLILHNGNFWTVSASQPHAQAVAISN